MLISVTVICTGFTIYFANASELPAGESTIFKFAGIFLAAATLCFFAIQLPFVYFRNGKYFTFFNTILLAAGVMFWVQSNVFVWNFGELDGRGIDYAKFRMHCFLEIGVWIAVIGIFIRHRKIFSQYAVQISLLLMLTQFVPSVNSYWKHEKNKAETAVRYNSHLFEWTLDGLFDYSKEESNVIIFLLDGFGTYLYDLLDAQGVNWKEYLRDFTRFPNAFVGDKPWTARSMPRILTGYDSTVESDEVFFSEAFSHPSLFKRMKDNGYQCSAYSWSPFVIHWNEKYVDNIRRSSFVATETLKSLAELTVFRTMPLAVKQIYGEPHSLNNFNHWAGKQRGCKTADEFIGEYDSNTEKQIDGHRYFYAKYGLGDARFFAAMKTLPWKYTPNRKHFKLFDLQGPHYPYFMNENGEPEEHLDWNSELRQAEGTLRIVKYYLEKLKEYGCYDNSLIIIMSDHGPVYASLEQFDKSRIHHPSLFVKRPNDKHEVITVNTSPIHVKDTLPAILTELNLPEKREYSDAFSWFAMPNELADARHKEYGEFLQKFKPHQRLTFSAAELQLGKEWTLARKHVLFDEKSVSIELIGEASDIAGKEKAKMFSINLLDKQTGKPQFVSTPLYPYHWHNDNIKRDIYMALADIDLSKIPDGEYEIAVSFKSKDGNNYFARIERTLVIAGGLAKAINTVTKNSSTAGQPANIK